MVCIMPSPERCPTCWTHHLLIFWLSEQSQAKICIFASAFHAWAPLEKNPPTTGKDNFLLLAVLKTIWVVNLIHDRTYGLGFWRSFHWEACRVTNVSEFPFYATFDYQTDCDEPSLQLWSKRIRHYLSLKIVCNKGEQVRNRTKDVWWCFNKLQNTN